MSEPLGFLAGCLSKLQDAAGENSSFTDLFPSIICVGGQSAGKSSIIETIVGHSFLPRGQDMVTRCPLKIRLHLTKDQGVRIVFAEEKNYEQKEETFDNFEEVKDEIERRTSVRVEDKKNVSEDEILIDIYSPDYPDLQFIDLPGFVTTNVKGQDKTIVKKISELNLKYMRIPNTFILAIQDGTQDIGTSVALKNAEDVDPDGKRTVGVLTKLDLLSDQARKESVARVLENKTKPLKLGYFGVVSESWDEEIELPSGTEDEGLMHLDLCLQYMESVDMALVDQVQKILILMLVKRTLQFLDGGYNVRTSLLRKVQKMCHDKEKKEEILLKGAAYEEMIRNLVEKKRACTETIEVIKQTRKQLRTIKKSVNRNDRL